MYKLLHQPIDSISFEILKNYLKRAWPTFVTKKALSNHCVPNAFLIISLKLILKWLPLHRFLHLKRLMVVIDE